MDIHSNYSCKIEGAVFHCRISSSFDWFRATLGFCNVLPLLISAREGSSKGGVVTLHTSLQTRY